MNDKTKEQFIAENKNLRQQIDKLEESRKKWKKNCERFKMLFTHTFDAIFIHDLEGHFLEANHEACSRLGYSREEFMQMTPIDIDAPEHAALVPKRIAEIQRKGSLVFESTHVRKDGSVIFIEIHSRIIDFEGQPGVLSVCRDITEWKRLKDGLRVREQKYRRLFEQSNDAIFIHDLAGKIIDVNKKACQMLSYSKEQLLEMNLSEFQPKRLNYDITGREMVNSVGNAKFETEFVASDNTIVTVEISARFVDSKQSIIQGIVRDITDRKQTEEKMRASLQEKEILLKEIHHRVKNNLQIISSLLDMQADHIKDKNSLELYRMSQERIRSMVLVHELLYQSGDMAKIDFADYITALTGDQTALYGTSGGVENIIITAKHIFLPVNKAIPCGLILNELTSNCYKHAFPGNISGEIKINIQHDHGNKVKLTVSDNGVGLSQDIDIHNTPTIGLQLVSMLTKQLKGTVEVGIKGGTTFTIIF